MNKSNICVIGVLVEVNRMRQKNYLKIIADDFQN